MGLVCCTTSGKGIYARDKSSTVKLGGEEHAILALNLIDGLVQHRQLPLLALKAVSHLGELKENLGQNLLNGTLLTLQSLDVGLGLLALRPNLL